jgi:hypothetical protein
MPFIRLNFYAKFLIAKLLFFLGNEIVKLLSGA